jgi:tetratricopeptide (TPR) repeat protein
VLHGLTSTLQQTASVTGGVGPAERYRLDAQRAENDGDLVGATNALRLALAIDPDREDLRRAHRRLYGQLAASLADTYRKQARYEEEQERWAEAALSWSRVVEGCPEDAHAARCAARALLLAGGDLKRAKNYAHRAVELQPDDPLAHRVLGRIFLKADMRLNARRELEAAAKLDPSDEMVENLLRELKG